MADAPAARETERWRALKILRAAEMPWSEIVNSLTESGLLDCRNHSETRTTPGGLTFCTTCEDTVTQFWRRNAHKLREDEVDVLEARWSWERGQEYVARMCREHVVRDVEIVTDKTEMVMVKTESGAVEKPVTTRTVRRERQIDRGLLQLLSTVYDKMARLRGVDVDNPDPAGPTQRKLMHVFERNQHDEGDGPAN
jgi:hypothetical protein